VEDSLFCGYCGNASAFQIDLKLKHLINSESGCLTIELLQSYSDKVMNIVQKNVENFLEQGWEGDPVFKCANCHESDSLDTMGRAYDYCSYNCCPGCFTCGQWIDKDDVLRMCTECIMESDGAIVEDECSYNCSYYDSSLLEVLDHYDIRLSDLKEELGY